MEPLLKRECSLPVDPSIRITGLNMDRCSYFSSFTVPLKLCFKCANNKPDKGVIFKVGTTLLLVVGVVTVLCIQCLKLYMCTYMHTHMHTHTRTHARMHARTHARTHTHTHTHTHTYTQTHIHTHIHTYTHTHNTMRVTYTHVQTPSLHRRVMT